MPILGRNAGSGDLNLKEGMIVVFDRDWET